MLNLHFCKKKKNLQRDELVRDHGLGRPDIQKQREKRKQKMVILWGNILTTLSVFQVPRYGQLALPRDYCPQENKVTRKKDIAWIEQV